MITCDSCRRHFRVEDEACPFCARRSPAAARALNLVGGAVTSLVLAACYGVGGIGPIGPPDTGDTSDTDTTGRDFDEDGYVVGADCNDFDAEINPGATEVCDDTVDNDCDGLIDEEDPDCAT